MPPSSPPVLEGAGAEGAAAGRHRRKRERGPLEGMLVFQDCSSTAGYRGADRDPDLIVTLDDATGAIYSAFVVEEEGTMSSFRGLRETIAATELFSALYTDRGSDFRAGCRRSSGSPESRWWPPATRYLRDRFVPDYNARIEHVWELQPLGYD